MKHAPLNRLFRQLKLSRQEFQTHEQIGSEVVFPDHSLRFANDPALLTAEIARVFPGAVDGFGRLAEAVRAYDPFAPAPRRSARELLGRFLPAPLLTDMLLLPLMVFGNAEEEVMDLAQFVIMFRAIFLEGFFRPQATIKEFLDLLVARFLGYGGELRYRAPVAKIVREGERAVGVRLAGGEEITAGAVLSTVGVPGTADLADWPRAERRGAACRRRSWWSSPPR